MLPLERQRKILQFLKKNHVSTVSELASYYDVHEATIRRDLTTLDKQGQLKRTHGGVMLVEEVHSEPSFHERETFQQDEKIRIGKEAAKIIQDGDNVILDSGTTTLHIAKLIREKENLTVITNDINIAATLRFSRSIKTIVTGGVLFPESYMLNGMITNETLQSLNVQKAFIAIPALHYQKGLTHFDEYMVPAKQQMIKAAKRVIVVADHTKSGRVSLHSVADTSCINELITGYELPRENLINWESMGVTVHLA